MSIFVIDWPEPKYYAMVWEPDEDDPTEAGDIWDGTDLYFSSLKEARRYSREVLFRKGFQTFKGLRPVFEVAISYTNGDGEVEYHRMVDGKLKVEKAKDN